MHLSRLVLNPRSRAVRRDVADCYAMHRTVMSLFGQVNGPAARARLTVLYRLDSDGRAGRLTLLVQSQSQPRFAGLPEGYLLDEEDNPSCRPLGPTYGGLRSGARVCFRLRANPTRRLITNGQRVELVGEQAQIEWLRRKAADHGFALISVAARTDTPNTLAIAEGKTTGWRPSGPGEKDRLTMAAALFEGEIVIRDADAFRSALQNGIGTAKAFGFGLLSIARPPAQ